MVIIAATAQPWLVNSSITVSNLRDRQKKGAERRQLATRVLAGSSTKERSVCLINYSDINHLHVQLLFNKAIL